MLYALNFIIGVPDEAVYIDFIKNSLNYQLAEPENEYCVFELVMTCWKHNKTECRFSDEWFLTDKAIIAKPFEA